MVNMRRRAIDFIRQNDYQEIYTFFDNDQSGEKTTQMFMEETQFKGKVQPQNHLYKDCIRIIINIYRMDSSSRSLAM